MSAFVEHCRIDNGAMTKRAALLAVAAFLMFAGVADAQAASVSVSVSADPTEDETVTLTVSGDSEAARRLFVYRQLAGSSCAGRPNDEANEFNTASVTPFNGDAVAAGSFSKTYTFVPTAAGDHRICAYVGEDPFVPPLATNSATATVRLPIASVSVSVSADPTEDETVTLTVSGDSEAARRLFVYRQLAGSSCAGRPNDEANEFNTASVTPFNGDAVAAGSFSKTYTFVPTAAGDHRICAYVGEDPFVPPLATNSATATVRLPIASVSVSVSADPTEDETVTLTVSGDSEAARRLFVYRQLAGSSCAGRPNDEANEFNTASVTPFNGDAVAAGSFSKTYTFVPTAAGDHRICAYVGEDPFVPPLATNSATATVRLPIASVSVSAPATAERGASVIVSISGTSEAARQLFVYRQLDGTGCAGRPNDEANEFNTASVTPFNGDAIASGDFTRSYTFTANDGGAHRICAYVGEDPFAPPLASGTATVDVPRPPAPPPVAFADDFLDAPREAAPPPAVLTAPLAEARVETRRPAFVWQGTSGVTDALFVMDGDSVVFISREDGTFAPDPDAEQDIASEEEYFDEEIGRMRAPDGSAPPGLRRVADLATFTRRADASIEVRVVDRLYPGRYTWHVERTRGRLAPVRSERRTLHVAGPRLKRLQVRARSVQTRSSRRPGRTRLSITTTPYSTIRVAIKRGGRTAFQTYQWGERSADAVTIDWSCKNRGPSKYRYTVTASDEFGKKLTQSGQFRIASLSRCQALRAAERRAREERVRRRRQAEERQRVAQEQAATRDFNRRVSNCHARNGQVRKYVFSDGTWGLYCVGPTGAFLPVG